MKLILIAVGAFVVIGVLLLIVRSSRGARRRNLDIQGLAEALDATEIVAGTLFEAAIDGRRYRYQVVRGSKGGPSFLRVALECSSSGEFTILRERRTDRWFKKLGIAVEIQTGDREFDEQFYIRTDSERFVRSVFAAEETREALNELFRLGYALVRLDETTLEARLSPLTPEALADPRLIPQAAAGLMRLRDRQVSAEWATRGGLDTAWRSRRVFVYICSVGSAAAGTGGLFWGLSAYPVLEPWQLFLNALPLAGTSLILFLPLSIALLKGRSTSHYHLLVNLAITIVGFPVTAYAGAILLNGYLDRSEPTQHDTVAVHKRTAKSKSSTRYYLTVQSWREGRSVEELKVPGEMFSRVETNRTRIRVSTKPGYFGFEWVASLQLP